MNKVSGKEKALSINTLICLVQGCIGHKTVIELRNSDTVEGIVDHVDIQMNVFLSSVTFTKAKNGQQTEWEKLYVQGTNIRYVHIPDHIDMMKCIEEQLNITAAVAKHQERKMKPKKRTKQERLKAMDERVEMIRAKLAENANLKK
jgi:small nuclear ribonucleoprotein (snRNP)-like protein